MPLSRGLSPCGFTLVTLLLLSRSISYLGAGMERSQISFPFFFRACCYESRDRGRLIVRLVGGGVGEEAEDGCWLLHRRLIIRDLGIKRT